MILHLLFSGFVYAQTCLGPLAIQAVIEESLEKLAPLLVTVSPQMRVAYEPKEGPIMAFAHIETGEKTGIIHLQGNHCGERFYADEIQVLLCHEIGHVAGGRPFMNFHGSGAKLSAEGQADFFATSTCLPYLWKGDDKKTSPRPEAEKYCAGNSNPLCRRIASASLNFQEYYYELAKKEGSLRTPPNDPGKRPNLSATDSRQVKNTLLREYPSAQCRLDIMKLGINCESLQLPTNFHLQPDAALTCAEQMEKVPLPACFRGKNSRD
jgi:hypothetical protein